MDSTDVAFTGSVPELYDRHLAALFFEPFAEEVARRFDGFPGDLLEVAAGTGILTQALDRSLAAGARIMATDLNAAMLRRAAARGLSSRVAFGEADGMALPYEDASYDAVVCQFGAMFFPDRVAGYAEARRVLRPGRAYVLAIWDDLAGNEVAQLAQEAVSEVLPDNPPCFLTRTPHGYGDTARIREDLRAAGFDAVRIETLDRIGRAPSARAAAIGVCQGTPLSAELAAEGEATAARVADVLTARLAERFGDGPIEAGMRAHIVTAQG